MGLAKRMTNDRLFQASIDGIARGMRYMRKFSTPLGVVDNVVNEIPALQRCMCTVTIDENAPTMVTLLEALHTFNASITSLVTTKKRTVFRLDALDCLNIQFVCFMLPNVKKTHRMTTWRTVTKKQAETTKDVLYMVTNRSDTKDSLPELLVYPSQGPTGKIHVRFPGNDLPELKKQITELTARYNEAQTWLKPTSPFTILNDAQAASIAGQIRDDAETSGETTGDTTYGFVAEGVGGTLVLVGIYCIMQCLLESCRPQKGKTFVP
jgi:hypothetical protein